MSRFGKFHLLMAVVITLLSVWTLSGQHSGHQAKEPKAVTLKGEVVDLTCYLSHGSRGPAHAKCAQMCLDKGLPMGLLTHDGALYVILEDHGQPQAYQTLKGLAAKTVTVKGPVYSRNGMRGIAVQSVTK
ncbi:MAG: hypothetical protein NZ959_09690 [Armatimonadetes bacterium]|nr:hypothetical protein [Armatimonadota bacterium]MDW8121024.1 hypothetical protein [Armatimonadota bacterium]